MKSAYNEIDLHHLHLTKEVKQWLKQGWIKEDQYNNIRLTFQAVIYHPNLMIRLLLFLASLVTLGGVTGILFLLMDDYSTQSISTLFFFYGIISFIVLEIFFIRKNNHYKSGVTEALLYNAIGFIVGALAGLEFNITFILIGCLLILAFSAIRFLDLISTTGSLLVLGFLIFFELNKAGGVWQQIIPFILMIIFSSLNFIFRKFKNREKLEPRRYCFILAESLCLLMVYAAGNYFVVREATIELLHLDLQQDEDIPLAFLFYFLTITVPGVYLFFGIVRKDIILLRISLVVLALSIITFKYYFSLGHHEITLILSGTFLLTLSILLIRYLRTVRSGFTSANILKEKWADANVEAYLIAQTLGTIKQPATPGHYGGGESGGGGSESSF